MEKYITEQRLPFVDEFAERTAIDPRKNVWEVLSVSDGEHIALLGRGRFGEGGAEPRLSIPGAHRFEYKRFTLIGNDQTAVTFLNPTTAVAGATPLVRLIIDQRERPSGAPTVMQNIKNVPEGAHMWIVAHGGASPFGSHLPQEGNLANLTRIVTSLQSITGWADVSEGIKIRVDASAAGEQDAQQLAAALKGFVGFGRLSTPDNRPDLLRMYDEIKVEQNGTNLALHADLNREQAESLLTILASSQGLRRRD
jgi:hypothetical protein